MLTASSAQAAPKTRRRICRRHTPGPACARGLGPGGGHLLNPALPRGTGQSPHVSVGPMVLRPHFSQTMRATGDCPGRWGWASPWTWASHQAGRLPHSEPLRRPAEGRGVPLGAPRGRREPSGPFSPGQGGLWAEQPPSTRLVVSSHFHRRQVGVLVTWHRRVEAWQAQSATGTAPPAPQAGLPALAQGPLL